MNNVKRHILIDDCDIARPGRLTARTELSTAELTKPTGMSKAACHAASLYPWKEVEEMQRVDQV